MNLPSGLLGGLGVDYISAFLSVGWIRGGLHFCILVCGVDYIFAFQSMGWIWGGLHFCILVYGWIIHFENLLGKNKSIPSTQLCNLGGLNVDYKGFTLFYSTYINYET